MNRIAVDVVILPDPTLDSVVVAANRDLLSAHGGNIRLGVGRSEGRAHLSLAMGVIEATALDAVTMKLARVVANADNPPIEVTGVEHADAANERVISVLSVARTDHLQFLHERVMETLEPFKSSAVEASALCLEGEPLHPETVEWIAGYGSAAAYDRFSPHITVGYGRIELPDLPRRFPAGTLAVCHLGNECTCRRVLVSLA